MKVDYYNGFRISLNTWLYHRLACPRIHLAAADIVAAGDPVKPICIRGVVIPLDAGG